MTSRKLTVYVDDSVRQFLKETATDAESISRVVNDALESYMSVTLVKDLTSPGPARKEWKNFPSLSEVERRRPKSRKGEALTSAEVIADQRRDRHARVSSELRMVTATLSPRD